MGNFIWEEKKRRLPDDGFSDDEHSEPKAKRKKSKKKSKSKDASPGSPGSPASPASPSPSPPGSPSAPRSPEHANESWRETRNRRGGALNQLVESKIADEEEQKRQQ